VAVRVGEDVQVLVAVMVGLAVTLAVTVGVTVLLIVDVGVTDGLGVAEGERVAVLLGVLVDMPVAVGLAVDPAVALGVDVRVNVEVTVAGSTMVLVGVAVRVATSRAAARERPGDTSRPGLMALALRKQRSERMRRAPARRPMLSNTPTSTAHSDSHLPPPPAIGRAGDVRYTTDQYPDDR
jgi:hypothetical protein